MRNALFPAACLTVMLVCAGTPTAQSLAEVARAEAARRKALGKTSGKVYTNDDLKGTSDGPAPAPDASTPKAPNPAAATTGTASPRPGGPPTATAVPPTQAATPPPDRVKDEKQWRARMAAAREALQRSQAFADALQSQINGLYAEFVAMGDPVQRAAIEKKRNEAIAELDRVKADIGQQTKAIAAIEEEARRASVPSGWLR
jgi:hypothetical protein